MLTLRGVRSDLREGEGAALHNGRIRNRIMIRN